VTAPFGRYFLSANRPICLDSLQLLNDNLNKCDKVEKSL
jgi:hypothetical protein